jgi:hypothetical protein
MDVACGHRTSGHRVSAKLDYTAVHFAKAARMSILAVLRNDNSAAPLRLRLFDDSEFDRKWVVDDSSKFDRKCVFFFFFFFDFAFDRK